jgi:hypothetical protein
LPGRAAVRRLPGIAPDLLQLLHAGAGASTFSSIFIAKYLKHG